MIPVIPPTPTSETFNMPVSSHLDSAVREGAFGFLIWGIKSAQIFWAMKVS